MNDKESNYLNKLFAESSDVTDEAEGEFPLVEPPAGLSDRLYAIAQPAVVTTAPLKQRFFQSLPKLTSVAATLAIAVIGFQFYQQQQTLKHLEVAQADLATALHYLGEANRITREQVRNSVNSNMRAGIEPAMEVGRDDLLPNLKELKSATNTPRRTL